VYIKDDCHLCDTMLEQLEDNRLTGRLETPFYLEIRDIEDHPGWYESYREYVPVVVVNGEEVCHYFFDQQEFESALSCP
jgi:hypothetical protein